MSSEAKRIFNKVIMTSISVTELRFTCESFVRAPRYYTRHFTVYSLLQHRHEAHDGLTAQTDAHTF